MKIVDTFFELGLDETKTMGSLTCSKQDSFKKVLVSAQIEELRNCRFRVAAQRLQVETSGVRIRRRHRREVAHLFTLVHHDLVRHARTLEMRVIEQEPIFTKKKAQYGEETPR